MGNSSQKLAEKCSILTKNEVPIVANSFKLVSKNSERIREEDLMKFWGTQFDPRLAQFLTNFLFGPIQARSSHVGFQRFAELYVYAVRGTIDERTNVLFAAIGQNPAEMSEIGYPPLRELVEAVCSSFLRAIKLQAGPEYQSWEGKGFRIHKDCVQKLAESLSSDIVQRGAQKVTRGDIEQWLHRNPAFGKMLEYVFCHLYSLKVPSKQQPAEEEPRRFPASPMLPFCEGLEYVPDYPAFIDISQLIFINAALPMDFREKWRFLFSSQIHGESFSTLLGRITDQGPTVIIIEDSNGYVFGGFAPASWRLSPNFVGSSTSFLFTLRPKMRCFPSSGFNDHWQYLNLHQQTMPNGLGMGGQHNYWGLWLDSEYGEGETSESCTTFRGYTQLSAAKSFKIRHVEVWGVGEKPKEEEDNDEGGGLRSVLDSNEESKAILKIAGRQEYSAGLREEPNTRQAEDKDHQSRRRRVKHERDKSKFMEDFNTRWRKK